MLILYLGTYLFLYSLLCKCKWLYLYLIFYSYKHTNIPMYKQLNIQMPNYIFVSHIVDFSFLFVVWLPPKMEEGTGRKWGSEEAEKNKAHLIKKYALF